jgi:hypothetical protein
MASDCRIGLQPGKPFGGVTVVNTFCAHSHRDMNNMKGGVTVVLTLIKPDNRDTNKPVDEQFHCLPHCIMGVAKKLVA